MTPFRGPLPALALGAASMIVLVGCAPTATGTAPGGAASSAALGTVWPAPPTGEVIAQGTVMDVGGEIELCLGGVAESYPPQCSGVPIENFAWDDVEGWERSGETTWGAYAVQGTYDGEVITVTQPPIMLALYDPMMSPDPTDGTPGEGDDAELAAIQEELPDRLGEAFVGSGPQDGRLWVDVVWDDGTWQDAADAEFGEDMVVIRSALRPVEG